MGLIFNPLTGQFDFVATNATGSSLINGVSNTDTVNLTVTATILTADVKFANSTIDSNSSGIKVATGGITNNEVAAAAGINFSKLASLTSGNILIGNGSNIATSTAVSGDIAITNAGVTSYNGVVPINKGGTGQTTANAAFNALSPMTTLGDSIYGGASGAATRLAGNITTTRKFSRQTGDGVNSAAPAWDTLLLADLPLASANIIIGNGSGVGASVSLSGDATISNGGVLTIANGAITDAKVASGAAIALSKLAALTTNRALQSDGSGVISVSAVTSTELGYVSGVTSSIQAQLNAMGSTSLTNSHIFVGNAGGVATDVAVSGDLTLANTGAFTIANSAVSNAKMANMANNTVKANKSGGSAAPSDLALSDVTETGSAVLTITNGSKSVVSSANLTIQVSQSTTSTSGYLSSTDWNTFNNKQSTTLTDSHILVGNGSNVATDVAVSGDLTLANTGAFTIASGAITNAKVNASAAIDFSKLAALTSGNILVGNGSNVAVSVTMSGDATIVAGGALTIANNAITNVKVAAAAAIDFSKLASLTSGNILVGSAGNVATSVTMSGDATIVASGALTIANNAVSNAKLAQMAAHTFKGNNTGSTANALDLTATQLTAELNNFVGDSGSGGTKGLVPAPASGDAAANKFLKADGTWSTVVSGTVAIANGGTGQTTKTAAFDALSPMTTLGDIIYGGTSGSGTRLAGDTSNARKFLRTQSSSGVAQAPAWDTVVVSDLALASAKIIVGNVSGVAAAVDLSGDATISNGGVLTISNLAVTNAKIANATIDLTTKVTGVLPIANSTISTQPISASDIDWNTGSLFTKTLGANTTFTFSNKLSGQTIVVRLTNTASNFTVTWPTVRWVGATPPTMSTGAVSDIYTFLYDGSNVYGSYVQNMS